MTIDNVLDIVCAHFGVPRAHLSVLKPNRQTIYIRTIATYMVRDLTDATYRELSYLLYGVDVRNYVNNLLQGMDRLRRGEYPASAADILAIRRLLGRPHSAAARLDG